MHGQLPAVFRYPASAGMTEKSERADFEKSPLFCIFGGVELVLRGKAVPDRETRRQLSTENLKKETKTIKMSQIILLV